MNLNRQQLSLLITFLSMAIVVLVLFSIHLGGKEERHDEYVVEMVMDEEIIEKLLEEEETKEEQANLDPIKSHLAYNETAKPSYGNPEPLKTLDEILQERSEMEESATTDNATDDEGYAERIKALAKKREEKRQLLGEKEAQKKEFTNNLAARRTSVSYSLLNRTNYRLPPPIYTCIEGGKVVINIVVNELGYVTDADFNERSSGTSNGCLVENAIAYALKSRFNSSDKKSQKGSITYLFQGK
ncbi:hypothetical protein [Maribacter sp. MAR_2009_72]|uniref:hypothetical protein n=1 Tax=Maribacter sp. MAR_2009_72 TaxID=1250050 RepID=UPI00119ACDCD|nr:hypothetical protein [Maribacter sp. MAR_2009_72]TVZ15769.1 hypothetical protein JM81_2021 [Maribacter sp. MAR_2009_72]